MDKLKYIKLENEDGSYSNSIPLAVDSNYVDVNGHTLTEELNKKATKEELVSIASGSPAGVYTTINDLILANPDHTKIYLVSSNGNWYYYNNSSSSWIAGGIYQAYEDSETVNRLDYSINEIDFPTRTRQIFDVATARVENWYINSQTLKIKQNDTCRSVIIPVDISKNTKVTISRGYDSQCMVGQLATLNPNVEGDVIKIDSVASYVHNITIDLNENTVALLVWYYYNNTTNPEDIIKTLMVSYGEEVVSYEPYRAIFHFDEYEKMLALKTYKNNKLIACGDSITAGYPDYTVGSRWWEVVGRTLNYDSELRGQSGSGMSYWNGNNGCRFAWNTDFSNYNIAIFAFGTNDYGNNIPLGNIDDPAGTQVPTDSSRSFYSALNYIVNAVKTKNPNCILIFSLPINRTKGVNNQTVGSIDTKWAYGVTNDIGYTLNDYCEAIVNVCNKYGLPYIDHRNGAFDVYSIQSLLSDGLHPTTLGYEILAQEMCGRLNNLIMPYIEY